MSIKLKKILKSREITSVLFIIGIFLLVGIFNLNFLSANNIFQTINGSVVYALVALGMSFVLFTGEIDVSIGATLGFAAALAGTLINKGLPLILVVVIVILFGVAVGVINSIGILYFDIPSIIMTLGTNGVIRGLIYVYTDGKWIENLPLSFKNIAQIKLFNGFSLIFILVILLSLCFYFVTEKTEFGKSFKAVGDNIEGARLIGISVKRIKYISYIICSVLASLAGILYASRVGFVTPTAGVGYEMTAIAACVIGGISLNGGIGTVFGSVLGSVIMTSISRVLVFLGFPSTFDNTITGLILIVIVVLGAVFDRRKSEKLRKERLAAKIV
ncbi:ABC transporter permease [Vagococcus zengguangii]|uniref:Autoinducer 2 import system permease protein LsrC n=1 Tax=Vagococcus zengguangii TaxID=2571750 RepID=A0A4D7CX22_9ENTE|nr:ABC transporter permease [Vagococcus zengguangii]QCI86937.1 ABC transporter permease [Vagococcus zengguangii]TLG81021.1 ABC transporter permease [Vagococcus zengguangii]